ncbi:uncharacterized protein LOC124925348 [Impatiens glandulifera]|uniref:uncharacterized protein LOC124925348 n=1 Tax=Impatiens glandulifera TaxID=253017 RepID=UPI001FB0F549|nr:uncharacterized protein LOC124925348 [Impatiens glandulifera]
MHQKKSEVQIGKESSGVSSDFNPTPPLLFPSSIIHHHQKHPHQNNFQVGFNSFDFITPPPPPPPINSSSSPPPPPTSNNGELHILVDQTTTTTNDPIPSSSSSPLSQKTTPHKRPFAATHINSSSSSSNSLSKSPTLPKSLHQYPFSTKTNIPMKNHYSFKFPKPSAATKSAAFRFLRRLQHLRRLRSHLRLILLLALPFFYFLVSHPSHSFFLDFISAFAFSSALLFSLNLAIPRLPSIRLFLSRSLPRKLSSSTKMSRPTLPVIWSIGSKPSKSEKLLNSGCWVQVYTNGDVYEGEFHKGKSSGSGVYYYYMSGRYEGDWVDNKYDGYGVETWARGSRYRGQYRQGLRNGFGVYRFYTGDVYAGEWSNGQSHGCGVHTCEDGSRYVGEFKFGVKHGLGHYHFRNGDVYAGEYFGDKMHGFGVYRFGNGHRYEGSWHESGRQGLGMYSFRSGETQSGHWNNGILDIPSTQTFSVSSVAVNHSKVLNAVQEARRAAEKAYDVGKVDERVNKAVAAANRAATAARVAAVKAVQTQIQYDER